MSDKELLEEILKEKQTALEKAKNRKQLCITRGADCSKKLLTSLQAKVHEIESGINATKNQLEALGVKVEEKPKKRHRRRRKRRDAIAVKKKKKKKKFQFKF